MQTIHLNQNQTVILDQEDFDRFSQFHWIYRPDRNGRQGYAIRHAKVNGKSTTQYLHRAIMEPCPGQEVIFLNHDRLDCRRANLRAVSKQEARLHHRVRSDSQSGAKGVRYNPDSDTWTAFIERHGHQYTLGNFMLKQQAVDAYQRELLRENPDLHSAPEVIDRSELAVPNQEASE